LVARKVLADVIFIIGKHNWAVVLFLSCIPMWLIGLAWVLSYTSPANPIPVRKRAKISLIWH
jgi:hypothetical protein